MKKICLVAHLNDLSGANKSLVDLADGLRSYYDVTVIVPRVGPLSNALADRKIKYKVIISASWVYRQNELFLKQLFKRGLNIISELLYFIYFRKERFDLVHYNSSIFGCGAVSAKKLNIPFTWHVRELAEENFNLIFFNRKKSFQIMNSSDRIITISQFMKKKIENFLDSKKITVVYNGVFPRKDIVYKKKNNYKIAIIGAISEDKGQIDAIRAIKYLKEKYSVNLKLYVVGSISDYDYYEKVLCEISENVSSNIIITGYKSNISEYRSQEYIALVCSKAEAFGRVTIEAMNEGQIVIGTTSGATAEIITDKVNGFQYRFGDYKSLADIIYYIINNDVEQIKINAHNTVENCFDIENTVFGIREVFNSII